MSRVLTIGTFDIPHVGHASLLRRCEKYGSVTVGINTDRFVKEYKGHAPVYTERERAALIRSLGYETYFNDGPGIELISSIRPDVLAIGNDWLMGDYLKQIAVTDDYFERCGISLVYLPYTKGISTSDIVRRVRGS